MKHTPGPWQIVKNTGAYCEVYSSEGFVAKVRLQDTDFNEANASLIAAAPEMLEALIEARTEITRINQAAGETVFNPAATSMIEYALAKARGES